MPPSGKTSYNPKIIYYNGFTVTKIRTVESIVDAIVEIEFHFDQSFDYNQFSYNSFYRLDDRCTLDRR